MAAVIHASVFFKCVDGYRRPFSTLCGLNARRGSGVPVTDTDADVTCRRCRRSRAWASFMAQEHSVPTA